MPNLSYVTNTLLTKATKLGSAITSKTKVIANMEKDASFYTFRILHRIVIEPQLQFRVIQPIIMINNL